MGIKLVLSVIALLIILLVAYVSFPAGKNNEYFLPYQGVLFESFNPNSPLLTQYYGTPTQTWQNGLIVNSESAMVGDYRIEMQKTDILDLPLGCKSNTCNAAISGTDSYGCTLYSDPSNTRVYYTWNPTSADIGADCNNPDKQTYRGERCYQPADPKLVTAYGYWVQGVETVQNSCGGVMLQNSVQACGFKYTIYKNNQIVAQRNAFDGNSKQLDFGDLEIQLGGQGEYRNALCNWLQNTYKIKIPADSFKFDTTGIASTVVQGELAVIKLRITNAWIDSVADVMLDVCQPTFSGEYCNTLQQGNVVLNRNSVTDVEFNVPTDYSERLTVTPRLFIKVNPDLYKITNMNIDCERKDGKGKDGSADPITACKYVEVGTYDGDPQVVTVTGTTVIVERNITTVKVVEAPVYYAGTDKPEFSDFILKNWIIILIVIIICVLAVVAIKKLKSD